MCSVACFLDIYGWYSSAIFYLCLIRLLMNDVYLEDGIDPQVDVSMTNTLDMS